MMARQYRALIVDDESSVRTLTVRAFRDEQFVCDEAADGEEAATMCQREHYDLVVTDLKMPRRHGYQLACDLLGGNHHPMIAVLTGVLEPRLAKDLYARGVDHIEFKPVDYDLFATRIKSLLARRNQTAAGADAFVRRPSEAVGQGFDGLGGPSYGKSNCAILGRERQITIGEVKTRLKHLAGIMPMSQAALDVVDVVQADSSNATQAAAAIARDASLAVEVLKLANSSFYNPSRERIVSLEQAVVRIGTRRVGELALAATVLTSLTTSVLPWMNVDLAWRRSIAAGLAVDWLVDAANLSDHHEGLFLCALMHGLGRIALGTVFPGEYESMVAECRASNASLLNLENKLFPESAVQTMMRLLAFWNVPTAECEPLKYLTDTYEALSQLDDVLRRKVELLKLSVLVGQLAVKEWESWDLVEFPPASTLERLNVTSVSEIVARTRADLFEVVHFRKHPTTQGPGDTKSSDVDSPRLLYCESAEDHGNQLPEMLRCMNIVLVLQEPRVRCSPQPIPVSMNGVPASQQSTAEILGLPCSFAALESRLQASLRPANETASPIRDSGFASNHAGDTRMTTS